MGSSHLRMACPPIQHTAREAACRDVLRAANTGPSAVPLWASGPEWHAGRLQFWKELVDEER